ncbi:TetR/AcrR family transcriptional regulator [Rhizobium ruizarguesonis]|jgi:AcrR family transcriptional regulator|uniref:TetR/AcrR family transcriptional regulator n=1 Tax=Rhizobium ruizarguesonis TaxID=2081791 RepID=UPI0010307B81|nr:TetR/AcrR family transcriptional regulator [Rhizobium ruizarguesonis]NEJ87455.1 TetR family transcriptional regulator [Rhizobium ruizarguesonis]TAY62910.1 TetR/AcrR family transcriptional regulator [Rhizobium ruizarguesonis]TAZ22708.1 TetR/AcrR family transcriptional regulator [Rhizobium ruizarguesonis]TBA55348.1 TetR/AcrR family transcriptional regulator [Rhizobium ruizarguesonis]TBB16121.1 TetR/AcrR family transcriptional regulator [Rhizobium ruizarguesonis]
MRYSAEHKQETRTRVIAAAGRVFRQEGYGGAGIDALTKAAGVTNGAFYGHFKSKGEAFRTAVLAGLEELRQGIAALKASQPKDWLTTFVGYYLGYKRTCDLGESCALPSLSPDVMRADDETRSAYTAELKRLIEEVAVGLPEGEIPGQSKRRREDQAILLLAMLSGGVTLARAASDLALSKRIADVIAQAALTAIEPGN